MNKAVIVSDSTIDLTKEDYEKNNIRIVPLIVRLGEKQFKDGVDISALDIFNHFKETKELPATAAVSSEELYEVFKEEIDKGNDVVFVGIGSNLSSTLQAANIAKMELPEERVFIVDSLNLSSASGILALKGAKLAIKGNSASYIANKLNKMAPKLSAQFGVESLDFLHKGGRCSGTARVIGKLFHVHPIAKIKDQKLMLYKMPRGKIEAYLDTLIDIVKEDKGNIDEDYVMITCTEDMDKKYIDYVKQGLKDIVKESCIHVTPVGSVISSHCGPGTLGILYLKNN
ncbi:MAG: DegV family protein [Bacilli bacterium]|nr:DegV family protein [Bacilli bacterium]MDY6430451.1 DegV family protein [Bacilli bacterium]